MADEVAPGAWWLRGTRGCNVFAFHADDGRLAVVDTGFASSAGAILGELATLPGDGTLAAILLTHRHADHAGAAAALRAATGAMVVAGAGDCATTGGRAQVTPGGGGGRLVGRLARGRTVTVDRAVGEEAEVLPGVVAVPVPGHTSGSLCFVVRRLDAAFVGDLVISDGGDLARPLPAANEDDRRYLATLATFAGRAPAAGFPGHGTPLAEGFDARIRALAALPRRRGGPAGYAQRARRLAAFAIGVGRRRR